MSLFIGGKSWLWLPISDISMSRSAASDVYKCSGIGGGEWLNVRGLEFVPDDEMMCRRRLVGKPNLERTCSGGHGTVLGGSRSHLVGNIPHIHGIGSLLVAFWCRSREEEVVGK